MIEFLAQHFSLLTTLHVLAMAVGLGAATVTDVLFFRFLKDGRLSEVEASTLNTMSKIVWSVIPFIVITGLGLLMVLGDQKLHSPQFWMKMTIVAIIILNGTVLSGFVGPRILRIFGENGQAPRNLRRLAFSLGSISATSWYSTFVLGSYRGIDLDYGQFLLVYLGLLLVAITSSQIMENKYTRNKNVSN